MIDQEEAAARRALEAAAQVADRIAKIPADQEEPWAVGCKYAAAEIRAIDPAQFTTQRQDDD